MFRKMAIALVAASVFTAPVLAQNNTLSGGGSNPSKNPSSPAPSSETPENKAEKAEKAEKPEKSAENAEKSEKTATHHRRVARHHHHGTKAAKLNRARTSVAMNGRHHTRSTREAKRYARTEGRRTHGRARAYGRGSKRTLSKPSVH